MPFSHHAGSSAERHYVGLSAGDLHLRVHGDQPSPLVLLHDSPGSGASLTGLAEELSDRFTVICPDLPGHGGTTATGDLVEVLAEALRTAGVRAAPVAGVGFGAVVAAALAALVPDICPAALVFAADSAWSAQSPAGNEIRPGGGHLLDAWWAVRRASMTRPWSSQRAQDRTSAAPAPAAAMHAAAVDVMSRHAAVGLPAWDEDASVTKLTGWTSDAIADAAGCQVPGSLVAAATSAQTSGERCGYVHTRSGLVHHRGRGTDDGQPAIVVLPPAPGSSASVSGLVEVLSAYRRVVALDYPGHGRSDPLPQAPASLDVYLDVIDDTIEGLGLSSVDMYGSHSGALLAVLFQRRHPGRVRSLVLDGVPLGSAFQTYDLDRYLPDLTPDLDGHHVLSAWGMANDRILWTPWYRHDEAAATWQRESSLEAISAWTVDLLRSAESYRSLYRLILEFALEDAGPQSAGPPTMICRTPGDVLAGYVDAVHALLPYAAVVATAGHHTLEAAQQSARSVADFLAVATLTNSGMESA